MAASWIIVRRGRRLGQQLAQRCRVNLIDLRDLTGGGAPVPGGRPERRARWRAWSPLACPDLFARRGKLYVRKAPRLAPRLGGSMRTVTAPHALVMPVLSLIFVRQHDLARLTMPPA